MKKMEKLKEDNYVKDSELDRIISEKLLNLGIEIPNVKEKKELEEIQHHQLKHLPPHKTKKNDKIDLNLEDDFDKLMDIFDDEFTAEAVIKTMKESPLEIQVIAKIVLNLYEKVNEIYGE